MNYTIEYDNTITLEKIEYWDKTATTVFYCKSKGVLSFVEKLKLSGRIRQNRGRFLIHKLFRTKFTNEITFQVGQNDWGFPMSEIWKFRIPITLLNIPVLVQRKSKWHEKGKKQHVWWYSSKLYPSYTSWSVNITWILKTDHGKLVLATMFRYTILSWGDLGMISSMIVVSIY